MVVMIDGRLQDRGKTAPEAAQREGRWLEKPAWI